jgi:hypothetical protein
MQEYLECHGHAVETVRATAAGTWHPGDNIQYLDYFVVFRRFRLSRERNCKENPAHHVVRFEILLRAVRVRIMTTNARLRNRFICIECLENWDSILGRHAGIGPIRIHEDLRKA